MYDVITFTIDSTESVTDPFKGIAAEPFSREIIQVLESSLKTDDIEIKPDGTV